MRHDMARCGCGVLVQLPSLKTKASNAKCEACARESARLLNSAKWADLPLPATMPMKLQNPEDAVFFDVGISWPAGSGRERWATDREMRDPDNVAVCTAVDAEKGTLTFSSFPKPPESNVRTHKIVSARASQGYHFMVDEIGMEYPIESRILASHVDIARPEQLVGGDLDYDAYRGCITSVRLPQVPPRHDPLRFPTPAERGKYMRTYPGEFGVDRSKEPKPPKPLFAVSRSLRADQAYAVDTSAFQRAIEQESDALHAHLMEALYGPAGCNVLTQAQIDEIRATCACDDADDDEELYGCD